MCAVQVQINGRGYQGNGIVGNDTGGVNQRVASAKGPPRNYR